ncbi:MAG TPA: helix-turn-helix transcriptional regulator [Solirubrobacteraceae bacterium]|nr:helix-turn-helix transcriptional regulator [Solirubrobacteraceae bacterium]
MRLGANLVAIARQRAGLSQRALAARLGVPPSTVARWEAGEHSPSLDSLQSVVRACGLDLVLGLANRDDSYRCDVARRLAMTPTERVRDLAGGEWDPLSLAAVLYRAEVRYVLVGDVAAAAHGWPITLSRGEYLIVPEDAKRNVSRLRDLARQLGAGERRTDAPFGDLDVTWRWPLSDGGELAAAMALPGVAGYRDLRRRARHVALRDAVVQLCSLRDLIRIADASPRPERRAFLPALWATLEITEDTRELDTRAA